MSRVLTASEKNADDELVSGINVTPLVDITLVLLIIFMVTATIVVSPSLPMDFPKESPGREVQPVFGILLEANGDIFVDGERLPSDESVFAIAKAAQAKHEGQLRAFVRADSAVQHGRVIRVLDFVKRAGIDKIAFGVSTAPPKPPRGSEARPAEAKP